MKNTIKAIAIGASHILATTLDGKLFARGHNRSGQLGTGDKIARFPFVQLPVSKVIAIAAGIKHSLYLTEDGRLFGMGDNSMGQLGTDPADQRQPIQIDTQNAKVTAIAASDFASFYATDNGKLICRSWDLTDHLEQIDTNGAKVTAIATGGNHLLYLTDDGRLFGMGSNYDGQLGPQGLKDLRFPPTQIDTNGAKIIAIATGFNHSLYLTDDGKLFGMGNNSQGQLGTGDTINRATPVQIATNVAAIAAGNYITTYLTTQGKLMGMGLNFHNSIIDDNDVENCLDPTQIDTKDAKISAIAASLNYNAYGTTDGKLVIKNEEPAQIDINENAQELSAEKPQDSDSPEDPTIETPETEPTMSI
jgi:alpha-tubulin suppressor-like RCC1 family protein